MRKNKRLKLKPETIRCLQASELTGVAGGVSGEPCDTTVGHTKCDAFGCTGGQSC